MQSRAPTLVWILAAAAEIHATDTIPQLVEKVHSGDAAGKAAAAGALRNLAINADNQVAIAAAGAVAPLVALARGGDAAGKEAAAAALWILAHNDDNQVAIAAAGAIAPLVELARGGDAAGKAAAAAALGNLAWRNNENGKAMLALGWRPGLLGALGRWYSES